MKKSFFLLSVLLIFVFVNPGSLRAEVLGSLPEVGNPHFIAVDNENLYVLEKADVFIYRLKDLTLIKKFGKKGEGPREFRLGQSGEELMLFPQKDSLLVHSLGKISFFTKTGEFIKEITLPANLRISNVMAQAIGENFVALGLKIDRENQSVTISLTLFDKDFKEIKVLSEMPFEQSGGKTKFPVAQPLVWASGDKAVVLGEKDAFSFSVYNSKGDKVATISRDYQNLPLDDAFKQKVDTFFKTYPPFKPYYDMIKQRLAFKDQLPAVHSYWASNQNLFIETYKEKDGKKEFFVYGFDGKLKKQLYLPIHYTYGMRISPAAVCNNTFYQIIENEDEEEFELHATKVLDE